MLGRFLEQQMWIYRPCCVFSSFSENTLEKMYFNGNWIFILSADTLSVDEYLSRIQLYDLGKGVNKQHHYLVSQIYAGWGREGR